LLLEKKKKNRNSEQNLIAQIIWVNHRTIGYDYQALFGAIAYRTPDDVLCRHGHRRSDSPTRSQFLTESRVGADGAGRYRAYRLPHGSFRTMKDWSVSHTYHNQLAPIALGLM
jgi:hypothetical protein